jgi:heme a synthase
VDIAVGLIQANTGLPIALVNVHMVLAVTLVAAMTAVVLNLKRTVVAAS